MQNTDEFIQNNVTKFYKKEAYSIANELWKLLEALDKLGCIRKQLYEDEKEKNEKRVTYISIGKNWDRLLTASNKFCYLYFDEDKRKEFLDFMRKNQFSDPDIGHLFNVQLIFDFLLISESFRNLLVFILHGKNFCPTITLRTLFRTLEKLTLKTGEAKKVEERLDIDLRNSLAHFTFKETENFVHSYKPVKKNNYWTLEETKITTYELLDKVHKLSIMRGILFNVIADWYGR
jgi:hypothetical protein